MLDIILIIFAWRRGWKGWALLPTVISVALILFLPENTPVGVYVVLVAAYIVTLICMIAKPRGKPEVTPGSISSIASVPDAPNYRPVSVQPPTRIAPATVICGRGKLVMPDRSEILLTEASKSIGRTDLNMVVSPDSVNLISRQHFTIKSENSKFYVTDQNSANGTRLNGIEIKGNIWRELTDGDRIDIAGVAALTFRMS